jgi:carbamoyl-phosphate synthase large subunit
MNGTRLTIVRSAVGCLSAMALINELKKKGVKVIGTDCNPLSAGLYLCDKSYVVPRGDDPGYLEETLRICDTEKPDAILSGPEEEILVLSKSKNLFAERNILVLSPDYDTVKICADKIETNKILRRLDIPVPEIYGKENIKFPCIVKLRFGRGGREVFKAESAHELEYHSRRISDPVVQEFIEGTEYSVDGLADLDGNPLSIVPRVRLQVESGISVKGMTVYDEEIIGYSAKIIKGLKLIGPSCIQCIKNNHELKFVEINPRFGGGSILGIKADPTIITNLIRIVKCESTIASTGFTQGLTMLRYYSEVFITEDEKIESLSARTPKER